MTYIAHFPAWWKQFCCPWSLHNHFYMEWVNFGCTCI